MDKSTGNLHIRMREIAQEIWDKHKVCVQDVHFSWVDFSPAGEVNFILTNVEINTLTKK